MTDLNKKMLDQIKWLRIKYLEAIDYCPMDDRAVIYAELKKLDLDRLTQLIDKAHATKIAHANPVYTVEAKLNQVMREAL